jgi:hypothetical protein
MRYCPRNYRHTTVLLTASFAAGAKRRYSYSGFSSRLFVQDCGGVLSQIDRYGADSNSRKSALSAL